MSWGTSVAPVPERPPVSVTSLRVSLLGLSLLPPVDNDESLLNHEDKGGPSGLLGLSGVLSDLGNGFSFTLLSLIEAVGVGSGAFSSF